MTPRFSSTTTSCGLKIGAAVASWGWDALLVLNGIVALPLLSFAPSRRYCGTRYCETVYPAGRGWASPASSCATAPPLDPIASAKIAAMVPARFHFMTAPPSACERLARGGGVRHPNTEGHRGGG